MKKPRSVLLLRVVVVVAGAAGGGAGCDPVAEGEGEGDAGGEGEGEGPVGDVVDNDHGFDMRTPISHELPCDGDEFSCPDDTSVAREVAYVCSLGQGVDGVVYVHARPTSIDTTGFPVAIYDDVRGFLSRDGVVSVVDAAYDYGGNHNNDFFSVAVDGVRYTFDHSSYGFGFRACQPPDCLKIEDGAGGFVDGCNPDRTVAEACVEVKNPLPALVDNFAICNGDPG